MLPLTGVGAPERGARPCGAELRGAELCGAELCGAELCGADLCGAGAAAQQVRTKGKVLMFSNTGRGATNAGREVRRGFASTIVIAMRNDLLRSGVERMLQGVGVTDVHTLRDLRDALRAWPAGNRILIALLSEIDDTAAAALRAAEASGTKVMLLLGGNDDVAEVSRTGTLGIRGAGFVTVDSLSEGELYDALTRMENGEVPIPPELARNLVALAGAQARPAPARPRLTPRESEALGLMVEGMSNKQIARRLRISEHGAKRLVANVLGKLDVANRTLAVAKALREGLHERPGRFGH